MYDNNPNIFDNNNTIGTVILVIMAAMFLFVVCALLGAFVDGGYPSSGTRAGVVVGWGLLNMLTIPAICITRH